MLRQTKCFYTYPSKTVLEDLVTRDGPATYESWSPFHGQLKEVKSQFVGSQQTGFIQSDFLSYIIYAYKDLNPSSVKEVKTFGVLKETSQQAGKYVTLEDLIIDGVESEKVLEYVRNMCVGYKKDSKSPLNRKREFTTRIIKNYDDDGEDEEEKFKLIKDECEISNEDFEEVIRELPHIIKSIWSYSKQYKANLFSFIFAYMDIKNRLTKRSYVTVTDFKDYPTFLIKEDGTYVRNFVHANDNKYVLYPNATKIFICSEEHHAEFGLCVKFMDALNLLGIDYRDENPYEYNKEFVESIVCSYLPNNEQYFNEYKDLDVEVMVALKPENIFVTSKSSMYANTFNNKNEFDYSRAAFFVSERIKLAYQMGDINDDFFVDRTEEVINYLSKILTIESKSPVTVPRQFVSFETCGILHFKKDVFALSSKYFGDYGTKTDYRVALTKYGQLIILEEEIDDVLYVNLEDTLEVLEEYEAYGKVQSEVRWKRLGIDN